jgi:hypothetical protein
LYVEKRWSAFIHTDSLLPIWPSILATILVALLYRSISNARQIPLPDPSILLARYTGTFQPENFFPPSSAVQDILVGIGIFGTKKPRHESALWEENSYESRVGFF